MSLGPLALCVDRQVISTMCGSSGLHGELGGFESACEFSSRTLVDAAGSVPPMVMAIEAFVVVRASQPSVPTGTRSDGPVPWQAFGFVSSLAFIDGCNALGIVLEIGRLR